MDRLSSKQTLTMGGWPERSVIQKLPFHKQILKRSCQLSRGLRKIAISGSLSKLVYADTLPSANYPVFESKHQVPRGVFKNEDLVVEKFLPEKKDGYYYLRSYTFLGNEGLTVRTKSEFPVIKGASGSDLEFVPVDDAIVTARNEEVVPLLVETLIGQAVPSNCC